MPAAEGQVGGSCTVYTDEACPYAERVFISLSELGVPGFKRELIDMANKPESYVQLYRSVHPDPSATVRIPLIIDVDGTMLIESVVIVEYLSGKYGGPDNSLLPTSPTQLAKVRLFLEAYTGQFVPIFYKMLRQPQAAEEHRAKLESVLKVLNAYLLTHGVSEGGDYFLGGRYSLAEIVASPHLKRMLVALPAMRDVDPLKLAEEEGLARLAAWMKACVSRPSVQSQVASDDQLLQAAEEISKE